MSEFSTSRVVGAGAPKLGRVKYMSAERCAEWMAIAVQERVHNWVGIHKDTHRLKKQRFYLFFFKTGFCVDANPGAQGGVVGCWQSLLGVRVLGAVFSGCVLVDLWESGERHVAENVKTNVTSSNKKNLINGTMSCIRVQPYLGTSKLCIDAVRSLR